MNTIQGFSTAQTAMPLAPPSARSSQDAGGLDFKNLLLNSINDVNAMQLQADMAVESLMTGGDVDPAAVLTAVQKADLGFRLMMQMRNKVMGALQEVKDIRV
ncbi:MAG: flagellar hook-basal body complex protein FliE [Planctomycetaceae bacterium]|nr:flagellar hook-basal body complex protein FliE [Planctomycetaceae bacterium]